MDQCCEKKAAALVAKRQGSAVRIVLGLNLTMFVVELVGGQLAHSTALFGDSLDMLGDTLAYGATLFALHKGMRVRAQASLFKSGLMGLVAIGVIVQAVLRTVRGTAPEPAVMGAFAALAFAANAACLVILMKHRDDDTNMRSAWACSRNDLASNVLVIAAGALVAATGSWIPDVAVGVIIASLYLTSSISTLLASSRELRTIASQSATS